MAKPEAITKIGEKPTKLVKPDKVKEGITLLVPARNEESRLELVLKTFKPYVEAIVVVENGSTDKTVEIAKKYADVLVQPKTIGCIHNKNSWAKLESKEHPCTIYNAGQNRVETVWTLAVDCDEIWDKDFIKKMKRITEDHPQMMCFRFPRINLPNAEKYPDYQVRLVKSKWTFWKHNPHVNPYFRGQTKKDAVLIEHLLDQLDSVVLNLDQYPILHSPRRKDIKRPWWGLEL